MMQTYQKRRLNPRWVRPRWLRAQTATWPGKRKAPHIPDKGSRRQRSRSQERRSDKSSNCHAGSAAGADLRQSVRASTRNGDLALRRLRRSVRAVTRQTHADTAADTPATGASSAAENAACAHDGLVGRLRPTAFRGLARHGRFSPSQRIYEMRPIWSAPKDGSWADYTPKKKGGAAPPSPRGRRSRRPVSRGNLQSLCCGVG
jgi:hypothetical protein